jgi:hypothetical protein
MSDTKNYRISFEYAAEDPVHAVIYLLGIIGDPVMQDIKYTWIVTNLATGEESTLALSLNELNEIAKKENDDFLGPQR